MSPQSATPVYSFATSAALTLFDGGRLTSDGGLPWLAEAEEAIGICRALAACVPAWRRAHIDHSIEALTRQRVFGIACGYEDQNDADTLRSDPLLKLVCGRRPESDADLASQPTLSRFENAVGRHACRALAHALLGVYLRARERDGRPTHIVLDIDSTDDPTHGEQEGTAYHGYYRPHMYHPLLVFDGDTDQLVVALLRPGNAHASRGVLRVLRVLIRALRARWPGVTYSGPRKRNTKGGTFKVGDDKKWDNNIRPPTKPASCRSYSARRRPWGRSPRRAGYIRINGGAGKQSPSRACRACLTGATRQLISKPRTSSRSRISTPTSGA